MLWQPVGRHPCENMVQLKKACICPCPRGLSGWEINGQDIIYKWRVLIPPPWLSWQGKSYQGVQLFDLDGVGSIRSISPTQITWFVDHFNKLEWWWRVLIGLRLMPSLGHIKRTRSSWHCRTSCTTSIERHPWNAHSGPRPLHDCFIVIGTICMSCGVTLLKISTVLWLVRRCELASLMSWHEAREAALTYQLSSFLFGQLQH